MERSNLTTRIVTFIAIVVLIGLASYKVFFINSDKNNSGIDTKLSSPEVNTSDLEAKFNSLIDKLKNGKDSNPSNLSETITDTEKVNDGEPVHEKSKIFYGLSTTDDPSKVDLSLLSVIKNATSRTAIKSKSFIASSTQYIYFAWPKSFEPSSGCSHDRLTFANCFVTSFGPYVGMVRGSQTYEGLDYYVYRIYDAGVIVTFTIK